MSDTISSDVAVGGVVSDTVVDSGLTGVQTQAPARKPAKKAKKKAPKAAKKVAKKDGRGRPPVYTGEGEKVIVKLIRQFGHTDARRILHAGNGKGEKALRELRDLKVFPKPVLISMPTLVKLGKTHNIKLERGRRPEGTTPLEKLLAKPTKKPAKEAAA